MQYLEKYGSFYEVKEGTLFYAPAIDTEPPVPDMEEYGEVTCVDSVSEEHGLQFLNKVNSLFSTSFALEDFAGR